MPSSASSALIERHSEGCGTSRVAAARRNDPSRATAEDVEAYAQPLQVDRWDQGLWHVFSAEPPPELTGLLGRIEVPTLVVSGDSDTTIAPRFNRRTASRIPGAEYAQIEGCGHTPHEECPQEFAAVVRDFLDRLPG